MRVLCEGKRRCSPTQTPVVPAEGQAAEHAQDTAVTSHRGRATCPSRDLVLGTVSLFFPSLMNKSLDSGLAAPEMTLTRSHTGLTFFVFRGLFPHLGGGSCEERRAGPLPALHGSRPRAALRPSCSRTFAVVSVAPASGGRESGPSHLSGTPGGVDDPRGRTSNPLPFQAEASSFSGLCCK